MKVVPTNMTIADYCSALQADEIVINKDYQRNQEIWPDAARSFLIETILLGFPMPKICLFQVVDLKKRSTVKEIVDGQQRTGAIRDFYDDKFRLSKKLDTPEVAGRHYSELTDEFKEAFISYQLSIDLFVQATQDEIQEVFRRINAYTAEALPEEQRHAKFQGAFKWFIVGLAKEHSKQFRACGILKEQALVRMGDCKLLTELCCALDSGITTTKREQLDEIYERYDDGLSQESAWKKYIRDAFDEIMGWEALHNKALMTPYCVYSLALATIHTKQNIEKLRSVFSVPKKRSRIPPQAVNRLLELNAALDADVTDGKYAPFVLACSEKTNVKEQREVRFLFFCRALAG